MNKLKMQTPDITSDNIEKIAALFPSVVTEMRGEDGKVKKGINFEMLKQLLSPDAVDGDERYEFTWVGKKAAIAEAARPITKTLRPLKEDSRDWDTTQNLYIEGDNLEALKILQESYLGKVKMIYIDPPYNTGHDFIYCDNYQRSIQEENLIAGLIDDDDNRLIENTENNGRFHSNWCSMIYSRLELAVNLLSPDGVIFISIDDNEVENLKKIASEIFGEKNFVAQLVWEKKKKGAFLSKSFINMKEYILVYAKNINLFSGLIGEIAAEEETYPCIKTTNARGVRIIRKGTPSKYKESNYQIMAGTRVSSGNMELVYIDDAFVIDGILQNDIRVDSNWIYSQNSLDSYSSQGLLYITQDNYIRRIVREKRIKMLKDLLTRVGSDGVAHSGYTYDTNLNNGGWGTNEDSNDELHMLLGQQYLFDFSKPSRLIAKLIQSVSSNADIVLDFFSGSATTADATMKLNASDIGHRKFIMIQLPEPCDEKSEAYKAGYKNICEIGKERIRRAGDKLKEENPLGTQNLDIGFRVFRVDESNMKDVYYHPEEITQMKLGETISNIKEDRTDLDLLYSCLLDWGVEIHLPHTSAQIAGCTVHDVDTGALVACFDSKIPTEVVEYVAKLHPLRAVFRDSAFATDADKINVTEIFKNLSPDTNVKVI